MTYTTYTEKPEKVYYCYEAESICTLKQYELFWVMTFPGEIKQTILLLDEKVLKKHYTYIGEV